MAIFIEGLPVPKGNHKAFIVPSKLTGRPTIRITDKAGDDLRNWQERIAIAVKQQWEEVYEQPYAVRLHATFYLPRPKCHFTKTGKPSSKWRRYPTSKPDRDKLLRAVQDALIGVLYADDSQVFDGNTTKLYADNVPVGVEISITICANGGNNGRTKT